MKKLISILLIPLLLVSFAACGKSNNAEVQNIFGDFNNTFGYFSNIAAVAESEDAFYFKCPNGKYIHYYDKTTGESGVLCSKPECIHDAVLDNAGCEGYHLGLSPCWSFNNERLFFKSRDPFDSHKLAILSVAADGTDLRRELSVPETDEIGGSAMAYCLHRDALYILVFYEAVTEAEPDQGYRIIRMTPGADEQEVIFERTSKLWSDCSMRFVGNRVYICCSEYTSMEGAVKNGFYYWDIVSGELNTILESEHEEGTGMFIGDRFYADEQGTIWFSPERPESLTSEPCAVYKVENGELSEAFKIEIPGVDRVSANMGEGVAAVMYYNNFFVYDLDGSLIFRGSTDRADFIADYGLTNGLIAYSSPYITRDYYIVCVEGADSEFRHTEIVLKFDFTEDGLVTTLLGSEIVE